MHTTTVPLKQLKHSLFYTLSLWFPCNKAWKAQGKKWNFLSVLCTLNLTFHWLFSTNPVEDRAKYQICMNLPRSCIRLVENSQWNSSCTWQIGNFIFRPVKPCKNELSQMRDLVRCVISWCAVAQHQHLSQYYMLESRVSMFGSQCDVFNWPDST